MPDPTLSDALAEAYASAPVAQPIIHTLSIYYAGLLDEQGDGAEVYVYQGYDGDRTSDEGIPLKDFRLEMGARFNGGEVVAFVCVPFDVRLPNVSSQGLAKGKLIIDGVSREISDHLLAAIAAGAAIEVTYRAYLTGLEDDGPQNDPPIVFGLENVKATALQVTGDIALPNLGNKRFPGEVYTTTRFPAVRE